MLILRGSYLKTVNIILKKEIFREGVLNSILVHWYRYYF